VTDVPHAAEVMRVDPDDPAGLDCARRREVHHFAYPRMVEPLLLEVRRHRQPARSSRVAGGEHRTDGVEDIVRQLAHFSRLWRAAIPLYTFGAAGDRPQISIEWK
jgi:hypothetical protein